MKKISLLAVFILAGMAAFSQHSNVINDPNAQKRTVGDFHGVHVGGGIELYLTQGNEDAVAVSANDPEYRDRIRTEVKDGILHIYMDDKFHWGWIWNNVKLRAYVSCKVLDELRSSGGSNVHVDEPIKSERLDLHISGGGVVHGKFEAGEMTAGVSGGGNLYLSGTAGSLHVHVSGGGDIYGYDLAADSCEAHVSGGGDVYVTVNKTLDATVHGGGGIRYKGNASIRESHTFGGGSISKG
ncbi:MAG TPA: head GIN domain-containing protein [Puia sp.]|nr:head GIN domain-containing protein [Puia sp.]